MPVPYSWDVMPPMDSQEKFIAWAVKNRGEDPKYLAERFERFRHLVGNRDTDRPEGQARLPDDAARETSA